MKTKHTPGPWKRFRMKDGYVLRESTEIQGPDGLTIICLMPTKAQNHRGFRKRAANSRLIAAAPDLLEALKGMVDYHTPNHWVDTSGPKYIHLNKARAAIAKATK